MADAGIDWLQRWRFRCSETLEKWMNFDPLSELAESSCPTILMTKEGYSLAADSTEPSSSVDRLEVLNLHAGQTLIISVDTELCYLRTVEVPAATRNTVQKALSLDLRSFMPLARDNLLTGHYVVGQGEKPGTLKVEQIVLRRDKLHLLQDYCSNNGINVKAVTFHDGVARRLPVALDLDGTAFGSKGFLRWTKLAMASYAALLVAGMIAAGTIVWHMSEVKTQISAESEMLRKRIVAIQTRLEQLKSSSIEVERLVAWKQQSVFTPLVIEELSHLLPDTAFIEGLTIDGLNIQVEGQAKAPESLIAMLEASPQFQNVAFSSPVFRNPTDSHSRFSLRMNIESPFNQAKP